MQINVKGMKHHHIKSNNEIFTIVDENNLAPGPQKCVLSLIIETVLYH